MVEGSLRVGRVYEESPCLALRRERSIQMEVVSVREASAGVVVALTTAGRSVTTIKRHRAELNAFTRFLQVRDRGGLPGFHC